MPGQEVVYEMLKQVYDPEVGINIVDMGLIYGVEIEGNKIDLIMTLTSPACPAGPHILQQVDDKLKEMEGIEDMDIRVVWTPPWSRICSSPLSPSSLESIHTSNVTAHELHYLRYRGISVKRPSNLSGTSRNVCHFHDDSLQIKGVPFT